MRITGITYVKQKKKRRGRMLKILILLILVSVLILASITAYMGWKLIHPPRTVNLSLSDNILIEYETVKFMDSEQQTTLDGWLFQHSNPIGTVIIAHGHGGNRLPFDTHTETLISSLNEAGFSVFTFDMRNSGTSGGDISTFGVMETQDILGAVEYLKSEEEKRISIIGFSTGASASIMAAAKTEDIKSVIADTPYNTLTGFLHRYMQKETQLPDIPFLNLIPYTINIFTEIDSDSIKPANMVDDDFNTPILFIHSENDSMLSIDHSLKLYNRLSPQQGWTQIWQTQAPGHAQSFSEKPDEYVNMVIDFIKSLPAMQ